MDIAVNVTFTGGIQHTKAENEYQHHPHYSITITMYKCSIRTLTPASDTTLLWQFCKFHANNHHYIWTQDSDAVIM